MKLIAWQEYDPDKHQLPIAAEAIKAADFVGTSTPGEWRPRKLSDAYLWNGTAATNADKGQGVKVMAHDMRIWVME